MGRWLCSHGCHTRTWLVEKVPPAVDEWAAAAGARYVAVCQLPVCRRCRVDLRLGWPHRWARWWWYANAEAQ
jgi:hypothetical protein